MRVALRLFVLISAQTLTLTRCDYTQPINNSNSTHRLSTQPSFINLIIIVLFLLSSHPSQYTHKTRRILPKSPVPRCTTRSTPLVHSLPRVLSSNQRTPSRCIVTLDPSESFPRLSHKSVTTLVAWLGGSVICRISKKKTRLEK